MASEVLLFIPNIIGYIRLGLLFLSLLLYDYPPWFVFLYSISIILDGLDGSLARQLNQTSTFGSWFDVVIDLISRGALWCFLSQWGYFIILVEWLTFLATHCRGANWKIPDKEFPTICKMVMAKGFKTPIGICAIIGLFVLPIWCYGIVSGFLYSYMGLPRWIQYILLVFLIGGRLLALVTELFFIQQHIKSLLLEDEKNIQKTKRMEKSVSVEGK